MLAVGILLAVPGRPWAGTLVAGSKPGSWKLPGTAVSIRVGGQARFNAIFDLKAGTGTRSARNSIPLDGSPAADVQGGILLHATRSRLWVKSWAPTDWGELATFVEGDFTTDINGSAVLRLREAYGRLGPVLAGQANTLFRFSAYHAAVIDTPGVAGEIGPRQGQIRYTLGLGIGTSLAVSIEDPLSPTVVTATNYAGPAVVVAGNAVIPDIVVALEHTWSNGRARIAGLVRQLRIDDGTGVAASAIGWGVAAGLVFRFNRRRTAIGMVGHYGEGVGRYLDDRPDDAIVVGASPTDFRLVPIVIYGGFVWVHHRWTRTISTNVAHGVQLADPAAATLDKSLVPAATNRIIWSLHANAIWRPIQSFEIGVEYMYAFRGAMNAPNGKLSRIQVGVRYRF